MVPSRHENEFLRTRHEVAGSQLFVPLDKKGFVMKLELLDRHPYYTKLLLCIKTNVRCQNF